MSVSWDKEINSKFKQLIEKMPIFMRPIAEKAILDKVEKILIKESRKIATEKDMVDAFFAETPFGFQGMMKNDLLSVGIDYTKYGYPK